MFCTSLEVEGQHIFTLARFTLSYEENAMTCMPAVQHHWAGIGSRECSMKPWKRKSFPSEKLSSLKSSNLTMDIRSFALWGQSRAPNRPRTNGTDLSLGTDLMPLNFEVELLAVVATMTQTGYCCSGYLHCCCLASRWLVVDSKMMTTMMVELSELHTRQLMPSAPLWIQWMRWAKCWAVKGSKWLDRRASNSRAFAMLGLSSCNNGSLQSNFSCPSRLSPRSDTRDYRQPSTQMCFPCRASRVLLSHVPRELSNRRYHCGSTKDLRNGQTSVKWRIFKQKKKGSTNDFGHETFRSYQHLIYNKNILISVDLSTHLRRFIQRMKLKHVSAGAFD
jgi:hypothetical protein